MELYQRLEMVLAIKKMPKYILGEKINVKQSTLTRYFCMEHQDKLKLHLWEIADLFPDINRDWLFFEEGKMLKADEEKAREDGRDREIKRLRAQLFVDGAGDKDARTDMGSAGEK